MFGFKIIKEEEYKKLLQTERCMAKEEEVYKKNLLKLSKDCNILREQLNEKITESAKLQEQNNNYLREVKSLREFKRDTLEAMGQIDIAGFRLSYCTKKCKHCEHGQTDCKKYQFGKHEYCVIPK